MAMQRLVGTAAPGSALPVEAFSEDARRLPVEEFAARHGSAFLLLTATGPSPRGGPAATEANFFGDEGSVHTADLAILVYPLRRRADSVGHLVTLGRAPNNDVVIPDPSVSRFHAFAKQGAGGTVLVQDAGSTNGTSVNGASVPAKDHGPPTSLKRGDTLRLGQVEFTFLDAAGMRGFALETGA
jgi:hypothetical protein